MLYFCRNIHTLNVFVGRSHMLDTSYLSLLDDWESIDTV